MAMASPSSDTVLIGCRIPNGHVLQCYRLVDRRDYHVKMPDGAVEKQALPDGGTVKLNGPKTPWGQRPDYDVKSGYAFTRVERKFWEKWVSQHKGDEVIVNKQIIVADKRDDLIGMASEFKKDFRSGLEPLAQGGKDPRLPKLRREIEILEEVD